MAEQPKLGATLGFGAAGIGRPLTPGPTAVMGASAPATALVDVRQLTPGSVFITPTEAYLLLSQLGEGGTARAFLAAPLRTAMFCGASLNPPPLHRVGVVRMLSADSSALVTLAGELPTCVLKVSTIPADHPYAEAIVERMKQEALCYGTIHDPRLPRLISASQTPLPYIALEYFRGPSLRKVADGYYRRIPSARMPRQRVLGIIEKLGAAVGVLHAHHVIHRDLKPENVIIDAAEGLGEFPRLIDLGVAKYAPPAGLETMLADVLPKARNITRHFGGLPLTPGYGAPEQFDVNAPIGPQADVYALGVITYELLAGGLPHPELHVPDLLAAMARPLPEFSHPELSMQACTEVRRVLTKATAYDASDRFPTIAAFTGVLHEVLMRSDRRTTPGAVANESANGGRTPARTTPVMIRAPSTARRRRSVTRDVIGFMALASIAALVTLFWDDLSALFAALRATW